MLESVWLKYKLGPCVLCLWVALPRPSVCVCVCVCLKVMFSNWLNVKRKALTKCVCSSSRMCAPDPHHSPLCVCPHLQMIDDPSSSRVCSRYVTFPVQIFFVCVFVSSSTQRGSPGEWSVFHFMFRILEAMRGLCLPLPPGTINTHTHMRAQTHTLLHI